MRFTIYRARRGLLRRPQWRWHLKAGNGRIIATSGESYNNRLDAVKAVALLQEKGTDAVVEVKE